MDHMDHSEHSGSAHSAHLSWTCEGKEWMDMGPDKTGSWSGHFFAGLILLVWTLHWNHGMFKSWLTQSKQSPFKSRNNYPVAFLPSSWPVEGCLKIVIPFFAIIAQLWGHGGFRSNICPGDTVRAGHFWPSHIYNWQNAWILFAFMVSGMVDVVATFIELPPLTDGFFSVASFALEAFVLAKSQHVDMLEDMSYYMLFLCAAGVAMFMLVEMACPDAFFASCGRIYCNYMHSIWYFAIARFLYEGRPAWNTTEPLPDMAPAMFVPVPFVFWMNVVSFGMFLVYLGLRWWYDAHKNEALKASCSVERTLLVDEPVALPKAHIKDAKQAAAHEMVPLVSKAI